ncbi:nuclease-related domain-containing protein [Lentibacillus salinarum]|uniref:Nuclease-related domain-containing protein n=1 Tax=Lentibacillus salinarum TaxID=446820 RepID=A0ABW3ZYE5_9BACI
MRIKFRIIPLPLQKYDAVIPRMPPQFPKLPELKENAKKLSSGYSGELKVDYHLGMLVNSYTILDDVYLHIHGSNFQIDSLVVTNHAIFIVEAKNYKGTITFDTVLKQLIRSDGKIESGFEYPITQVENQTYHLRNWLQHHNLSHIPIFYVVAIADPETVIKVDGNREEIGKVVAHAARIPKMIRDKDDAFAQAGKPKIEDYKIGKLILRECRDFDINVMRHHEITREDLLPGVICSGCGMRGMKRIHGGWLCKKCRQKSHNAHRNDLANYLLLYGSITNKECMWLLGLTSRSTATRILQKSGLVYVKECKCWTKRRK